MRELVDLMDLLFLLWAFSGFLGVVNYCDKHKTWCGIPIWREPSTYVMLLFVGPIAGPFTWIALRDDSKPPHR